MWKPRDFLLVPLTVVVAGGGLFWGGRNTYRSLRNGSPATTSCADFVAHPPAKDWVRLEGCEPDSDKLGIESMSHQSGDHTRTEDTGVYIPLRPVGGEDDRVRIVVYADEGPLLALTHDQASDAQLAAARDALAGPIEGLRQDALDMSHRDREDLRDLHLHLADEFAVIAWHAHPRPLWLSAGVLLVGCGAAGLLVRRRRRRERPVELAKAKLVRE